jgi:hypothetical protein
MCISLAIRLLLLNIAVLTALAFTGTAFAFEGWINAVMTQGNETNALLYTVGTNSVRVAMTATNWPHPVNILELKSGAVTLVFPHNRSFVRLKPTAMTPSGPEPGVRSSAFTRPGPPEGGTPNQTQPGGLPPGIGPQTGAPGPSQLPIRPIQFPSGIGPTNLPGIPAPPAGLPPGVGPQAQAPNAPGVPAMPQMPAMPKMPMLPMPGEAIELKATGETTNLFGFACNRYELKEGGETLEVWATDKLLPFQPYLRNQQPRFGPRMIEEQWPGLLTAKKLFPLRATLRFDNGAERFRFEVKSITSEKITDTDGKLFQPPTDYHEMKLLPF